MANTITLSQSAYKEILNRITKIERILSDLLKKFEQEPPYGSKNWWKWSDEKAIEDIKKGNYLVFDSPKKLQKYLDSAK